MTRLAILTDIHANLPALQAVMDDMQAFAPDQVIVAGDVINGGGFEAEVLDIISRKGWAVLRGNHESIMLEYRTPHHDPTLEVVAHYLVEAVGRWYATIACWPDELRLAFYDAPPVRVLHGMPHDNACAITHLTDISTASAWLAPITESLVIGGHFHIPVNRHIGGWHYLNPGPVGNPYDGIREARYLWLEAVDGAWVPTFRRVPYDLTPIIERYQVAGLGRRLGARAEMTLLQLMTARPLAYAYYTWNGRRWPSGPYRPALVDAFLDSGEIWDFLGPPTQVNRETFAPPTTAMRRLVRSLMLDQ